MEQKSKQNAFSNSETIPHRLTAVQKRCSETLCCSAMGAAPFETTDGKLGSIDLYADQQIVCTTVTRGRSQRAFLFRTASARGLDQIPGVFPGVLLLVHASGKKKVARLKNVLHALTSKMAGADLSELPDLVFLRLNDLIARRSFRFKDVRQYLELALANYDNHRGNG